MLLLLLLGRMLYLLLMGKAKQTRKFAQVKRIINPKDARLKVNEKSKDIQKTAQKPEVSTLNNMKIRELEKSKVGMFFEHNTQLGPPYHVLIDTNFINFSIQHKLDIF